MLSLALFAPERVVKRVKQPPHREGPKPQDQQLEQRPPCHAYLALRAMSGGTSLPAMHFLYKFLLDMTIGTVLDSVATGIARQEEEKLSVLRGSLTLYPGAGSGMWSLNSAVAQHQRLEPQRRQAPS